MSSYNPPPPPPEPNPYGQPDPYGQAPYGQPGYGQGIQPDYAHWGKRVGAVLIDVLVMMLAYVPALVGFVLIAADSETSTVNGVTTVENSDVGIVPILLIVIGVVGYIAVAIWNIVIKQGRTGYTIGKGVLGIKLLSEQTAQPIGPGMAFVRQLVHVVDSLPCYLGWLWPLWDSKKQTFADKIVSTIVVNQPKG